MCGICGFVGPGGRDDDGEVCRSMCDALRHRGPDGEGATAIERTWGDRRLAGWLGHRRLRVVDLSAAADQPMANEDGSILVTYNGEIYNFQELRRELEARRHRFRSAGDTEVLVHAYEQWGDDMVCRLDGMFAFALWDARAGRLLLARDRAGKKPLYYTTVGGRLTFASEIKALLRAPWVEASPDASAVAEYLAFGYVPHPRTMFAGVAQVPPASTVAFDLAGVHPPRAYWDFGADSAPIDDVVAVGDVRTLVGDAVRRRLVADVPLGALLSGGIDSSVVVGLMAQASPNPIRTFSVGFSDDPSFDERPYARLVAEHFRTVHTEFVVDVDAVALLDKLLWHHDQPYADSSAIPTYLVCKMAREHVTVGLTGDGGDEVFGGYDRFRAAKIAGWVPDAVTALVGYAGRFLPRGQGYHDLRRRLERFVERPGRPLRERYRSWVTVFDDVLEEVLTEEARAVASGSVTASFDEYYARPRNKPVLDRLLYANFKTYLPDDLLVKADRMAMASSLELRSPFLDTALVDHLARIPAAEKVGVRHSKPILRRALWPLLPRPIWSRKKHGFGVPIDRWFAGELGAAFADEVIAEGARSAAYVRPERVRCLWREQTRGVASHGAALWTLLTLERWLRWCQDVRPATAPSAEGIAG